MLVKQSKTNVCLKVKRVIRNSVKPINIRLYAVLVSAFEFMKTTLGLCIVLLAYDEMMESKKLLHTDMQEEQEYSSFDRFFIQNFKRFQESQKAMDWMERSASSVVIFMTILWTGAIFLCIGVYRACIPLIYIWNMAVCFELAVIIFYGFYETNDFPSATKIVAAFYVGMELFNVFIICLFSGYVSRLNKLREVATIALPFPAPRITEVTTDKNLLGSNGYKHILTDEVPVKEHHTEKTIMGSNGYRHILTDEAPVK